jgi:hypothetical protein
MANLLRRVSHNDVKKAATLARSKTYDSDLTKLDKRLPVSVRVLCVSSFLISSSLFRDVVKLTLYNRCAHSSL